jgi:adenylate kinase
VILITGVPGTGKTTISKLLSKKINATHIELSQFAKEKNLIIQKDIERDTQIVDLFEIQKHLEKEIHGSRKAIIIDGHYAQDVVVSELVNWIFVLRRAPWILIEELSKRGYHTNKIWENVESELLGTCILEAFENFKECQICEIDTSDQSPEVTLEVIMNILNGNTPCTLRRVDWLSHREALELIMRKT